jgi:hypothetical protein
MTSSTVRALSMALALTATSSAAATGPYEGFGDAGLSLLHGRWMSVSPFMGGGASQLGSTDAGYDPTAIGLRYYERKGFITGVFFALMNTVAGSMAAASPKSVNTYRSGNWIITETTYRSEAEKQEMLAQTAAASEAMMSAEDQSFDLEIYSTSLPGGGEVTGYKLNMSFGIEIDEAIMLDVGMGFGSVDARMIRDDRQGKVHLSYFGIPFRLNVAGGPFLFYASWDWNILGEWSGHKDDLVDEATRYTKRSTLSHLELGVQTVIFDRLLVQAGVTTPKIDSGDFGYRASVGLRF